MYQCSLPLEPVWLGRWSPVLALPWELLLMEPLLPLLLAPLLLALLAPLLLAPLLLALPCLCPTNRTQQR
tara:strand:+ start:87 stop:296 length:210 start_codon:yes stop_codon:yes gene_type:complete